MSQQQTRQVHVLVHGMVQGVGFRYHTQHRARSLGVRGWVRNLANGDVEVLAEGDADAVQALLDWLARGPSSARVSGVDADERTPSGLSGFDVTY